MKKIIIIGAGDGGRLVSEFVREQNKFKIIGFIDDNELLQGKVINGYRVIGTSEDLKKFRKYRFVIAVGMNMVARDELFKKAISAMLEPINFIHRTAVIAKSVKIPRGVIILPNCVVNPFVTLGENIFMFTGTVIEHDVHIGNNVYFSPGVSLAGYVKVGDNSFLGINSCVIEGINVGTNVIVGAGSCVLEDVPDNTVVAGVPAKVLRKNHG